MAVLTQQGEKLSFLIQTLVKASRLETGMLGLAPKRQAVQHLLDDLTLQCRTVAEEKGVRLCVDSTESVACLDRKWTGEALCNVVDNALKYTPAGGEVRVWAEEFELFCAIHVQDTGPGIPEGEQGAIFQRFYRGNRAGEGEGLGIGLYLTREILRREGGYVKVASRPGQGSRFTLCLPRE